MAKLKKKNRPRRKTPSIAKPSKPPVRAPAKGAHLTDGSLIFERDGGLFFRQNSQGTVIATTSRAQVAFFQVDGIASELWYLFDGKTPLSDLVRRLKTRGTFAEAEILKMAISFAMDLEKKHLVNRV